MLGDAAAGAIEAIYHCPHDWDEGCECRKPAPGMLFQAQREFDLDLTRTPFIGDDERDGQAAAAAGCPFAMVGGGALAARCGARTAGGTGGGGAHEGLADRTRGLHRLGDGPGAASTAGHDVVGLDTGYFADCTLVPDGGCRARRSSKDIRDLEAADLEGFDAVVHLAAL